MKTSYAIVLCSFWTGLLLAQTQTQIQDEDEIKATLTAMWDAIGKGDLERYGSYIHPDFTVFGENDVYLSSGKELELRNIGDFIERSQNVHTEMHQPEVTVKGKVAWITYYWTESGEVDGERFSSRGKSTRIFVKEDGKWLCIHGHYTEVP
jgi:ketosteroid isomerase-like protein